jgi:hypothetical protein
MKHLLVAIDFGCHYTRLLGLAQPPMDDPLIEGFRAVEVASVADAMQQLYGQRADTTHDAATLYH